jgi:hypothetical protein
MYRVQTPQLQYDEEQEEDDGSAGNEQVLPFLPEAHGTQGEQVNLVIWSSGHLVIDYCNWPINDRMTR